MFEPVVLADGYSYEQAAIATWLEKHNLSPVTFASLANKELIPNVALKNAIANLLQKLPKEKRIEIENQHTTIDLGNKIEMLSKQMFK